MSTVQSDQFANPATSFVNPSGQSSPTPSSSTSSGGSSTSKSTSSSDVTDSSAPGTVGSTPTTGTSKSSTPSSGSTSSGSQKAVSGQTGSGTGSGAVNNAVSDGGSTSGDTAPPIVTTSSSVPAATPTSTSSSIPLPTSTTSSTIPTSTSTSTHATSTSTSSTVPAPTPTSTSSTISHTHTVIASTNTAGNVVFLTSTVFPTSTAIPTSIPTTPSEPEMSGPNIGAIIGGIAGGLVGVILLTWLILIPIRKRAALKKEVDWMAFGSENDHHNNDSNNDSIYRTPRAGVGELEGKAMDSPELYAMSDINSGTHQGTLYSHLDANGSTNWAGAGAGAGMVANNVVGEVPPGHYDVNYAGYYPTALAGHPQHTQQFASYPSYSDHGSPEMGAQRYAGGQQPWPTTSTSSHGHGPGPVNNYPFAPPTVVSEGMSRNASLNDRVLLPHGDSFGASTVTAHDNPGLSRSASGQALASAAAGRSPPPPPPPTFAQASSPSAHQAGCKAADTSDDCALAYVLDDTEDTPLPDKGALPGLHLANPDR